MVRGQAYDIERIGVSHAAPLQEHHAHARGYALSGNRPACAYAIVFVPDRRGPVTIPLARPRRELLFAYRKEAPR